MSQEKNCYWLVPGSLCDFVGMGYHSIVYLSINWRWFRGRRILTLKINPKNWFIKNCSGIKGMLTVVIKNDLMLLNRKSLCEVIYDSALHTLFYTMCRLPYTKSRALYCLEGINSKPPPQREILTALCRWWFFGVFSSLKLRIAEVNMCFTEENLSSWGLHVYFTTLNHLIIEINLSASS